VPPYDAYDGPCVVTPVQAKPGTTTYQVMQNSATSQKTINEASGNLLVAIAYGGQNPGQTTPHTSDPNMRFAVTDSLGNTFYAGPMFENTKSNQAAIQIFYAANIRAGTNTVVATSSSSTGISLWTGLFLQEYSGIATSDVAEVSAGQMAPSKTTTISPPAMTTVSGCSLVVGAFTDGHVLGQTLTAPGGWFLRSTDEWDPGAAVDNAPNGTRANTSVTSVMNLTSGSDDGWVAAQMAFRASSTMALPQPTQIAFTTAAQSVPVGTCSSVVTIESQNAASVPTVTSTGIGIALSGAGLVFYTDPACAYPVQESNIGAGTSSRSFYFKGSGVGAHDISAAPSPSLSTAHQTETLN
jgi:hypothetical protein